MISKVCTCRCLVLCTASGLLHVRGAPLRLGHHWGLLCNAVQNVVALCGRQQQHHSALQLLVPSGVARPSLPVCCDSCQALLQLHALTPHRSCALGWRHPMCWCIPCLVPVCSALLLLPLLLRCLCAWCVTCRLWCSATGSRQLSGWRGG